MIPRSLAFVMFALSVAPLAAAEAEFVHVWPGWRDAASFKRISEYFTGVENTGGEIVHRTHPESRAGYYFLARVKHPGSPLAGAKFVLHVIMQFQPEPLTFAFPADAAAGTSIFELGLTGPDWPGQKIRPVAWKLELLAADGRSLAEGQSYLWSKPN